MFLWVVKRATSLFNSFWSNVAKQVARVLLPQFGLKLGEGAGPPGPSPGSAAAKGTARTNPEIFETTFRLPSAHTKLTRVNPLAKSASVSNFSPEC